MKTNLLSLRNTFQKTATLFSSLLNGVWQKIGIPIWVVVFFISVIIWGMGIYVWGLWDTTPAEQINQLPTTTIPYTAEEIQARVEYQQAVHQLGLSLPVYGGIFIVLRIVTGLLFFGLSILIMYRCRRQGVAVFFAILLVVFGAAGRTYFPNWWSVWWTYPWMHFPINILWLINNGLAASGYYVFPNGRFVPRWTRWVAIIMFLDSFISVFFWDSPLNLEKLPAPIPVIRSLLYIFCGIFAILYRFRHTQDRVEKQQVRWFMAGSGVFLGVYFGNQILTSLIKTVMGINMISTLQISVIYNLTSEPLWYIGQTIFALCFSLALIRYRLWDFNQLVRRVMIYGGLTVLITVAYLGVVSILGRLFQGSLGSWAFFLATGMVAIAVEPLRRLLQRLVNRFLYGERDDPSSVLTRLASTLERASSPDHLLPAVVTTVGQALKSPFVAIQVVEEDGTANQVAVFGQPVDNCISFPLIYQNETIGSMRVAYRGEGEAFSAADHRLIKNIAQQAGSAVQAVRLHARLIRSRAQVVVAREEERRRLRRDLHDGLGPLLASQTLKMAAARQLVKQNPHKAETLIDDVVQQNENTVSEVRRLVYGLRPPSLDALGLVGAVRDLALRASGSELGRSGMQIEISGPPDGLPPLPAAVEANAYRIALEALTNATRHAQAQHCSVQFRCEMNQSTPTTLIVTVSDDGIGISELYQPGVGLRSMRERAEELGGQLHLERLAPHGTRIIASLPIGISTQEE